MSGSAWGELEHALVTSWNVDTLAVYADHLQQRGDPRGALIALDLSPAPEDTAWRTERQSLLVAWLGEELAARAGHLVQHGFLHSLREDRFHPPGVLEGPLGGFVRSCTLRGGERDVARLASRPRPWLTSLTLVNLSDAPVSALVRDALVTAAPHLQELQLLGRPAFDAFMHPAVRRVYQERQRGARPYPTLTAPDGVDVRDLSPSHDVRGPYVTREEVDLALDAVDATPDRGQLQALYGGLFTDGDSLPALLLRLRAAGLVTLDGPIARLTRAGRVLRDKEPHRPPRVRAREVDSSKWVLWAETTPVRQSYMVGLLRHHARHLEQCLALTPLNADVQEVLVAWRHFLTELQAADDSERLRFNDEASLARAVETLLELWDLLGRELRWEDRGLGELRDLEAALGPSSAARAVLFRLVWGM
ncbi:hypothetical protein [Pyxidicoccus sp. MSG2]|uniref:hypothetical protein n=1 Tax=Pyxidicoccus sp. MSG2 TaxID=2996790 RepID=UPI0022719E90|nr:hypothetical protein [Pyxidicoccus sp. MSG2]MCY1020313.1 hypothetical protein [Pyxidicoccus sp. MSG2]